MDGLALKIWGAPEFQLGDEPLLFLAPGHDGSFHILHLMLGAFHSQRSKQSEFAVRDLSEAHRLQGTPGGESADEPGVRELGRFAAWIADRGLGIRRPADYWRPQPSEGFPLQEKYTETLAGDGHSHPLVQLRPGRQCLVEARSHRPAGARVGGPGLDQRSRRARFDTLYAGTAAATGGIVRSDGANSVLFNDPGNANMQQVYSCQAGGVVESAASTSIPPRRAPIAAWPITRGVRATS